MDSGFYAACTALLARSQGLDLIANNLANTSTPGYRAEHSIFRSVLANFSALPLSNLNQAVNNYSVLGNSHVDLSQGTLEHTGNELDLGLRGSGFFVVQTGAGQVLTRNGSFHTSANGTLVTSAGDPVIGDSGRIQIVGFPVTVSPDGTISVNGAVAGKLKIVDIPPDAPIESLGQTYYSAPAATMAPATQASVQQGVLEASNVNPIASTVELITVQRYAELMQRALSLFHNDMNQLATQELPKVSNNS